MLQSVPQDYYTWTSLGTLAVASGAVVVVANTARKLLKVDSPWVAFIFSVLLTFYGAYRSGALNAADGFVLAFLNSCLLFCAAAGVNQTAIELTPRPEGTPKPYGARPVRWLAPWLRRLG